MHDLVAWLVGSGPLGLVIFAGMLLWREDRRGGLAREERLRAFAEALRAELAASQEARIAELERIAPLLERVTASNETLGRALARLVERLGVAPG